MELDDLKTFLAVAHRTSLRVAAEELHQTPSAVSKAIRRLEASLGVALFDRSNKALRLNADGERLRERAIGLVGLAEQTVAELRGRRSAVACRVAAPAVLQWRFAAQLSGFLARRFPDFCLTYTTLFEDAALQAVARGDADFAFVSGAAVPGGLPPGVKAIPLGTITMQLAASPAHPLVKRQKSGTCKATAKEALAHDFACPSHSMFCGIARGARADGWRDDRLPRRVRYWIEDLQVLVAVVRSGRALAYLPDFAVEEPGLVRLHLTDCPYTCVEKVFLAWRPSAAGGWHRAVVDGLAVT